jgi:hypothetical protein
MMQHNGVLARNVVSLKIQFSGDPSKGYAGYREIDVQVNAAETAAQPSWTVG